MPLDFIPINLFSTRSTLPIPFLPAIEFNLSKSFEGDNFLPLIVTGSPFLNPIVIKEDFFGAFSGEVVLWKINSGAEFFGFSKTFPQLRYEINYHPQKMVGHLFYL